MKTKVKSAIAMALCCLILLGMFAGCKDNKPEPAVATEDGGVTYGDPNHYPIVAQPITLSAAYQALAQLGDVPQRALWPYLTELTGITIELRAISSDSGESVKLMYASRDYPDLSFRLDAIESLVPEAIAAGDIMEITDDMLNSFAPNWAARFEENPQYYLMTLNTDGKLYSFPHCKLDEPAIMLRDAWFVNGSWLNELGMNTPATIDDFTTYLRAVKNAAGTGSIPSNVVPMLSRHNIQIGGWYNVCDTFGLYNGLNGVIIENATTVKHNAQDTLLKDVMKYLRTLYSEGLMNSDFTTLNWAQYNEAMDSTGTSTVPWYLGCYFGYSNTNVDDMIAIAPPASSSGRDPVVRPTGWSGRFKPFSYLIYSNCEYPVAALRLADFFGSEEGAIWVELGEEGYRYNKNEDGTYSLNPDYVFDDVHADLSGAICALLSEDIIIQLSAETMKNPNSREYIYQNIYKQYVPDINKLDVMPPTAINYLTEAERQTIKTLETQINTECKNRTAAWIKGGDIDAEWDGFQQKLTDLGIKELLSLYQKAWDLYSAAVKQ